MFYINGKCDNDTETIDAFDTRKEALTMLAEYRIAYRGTPGYTLWISERATKEWREAS